MPTLIQGLRRAAADRGITLIVVGSIAMGIAVLTTVFAVASALLLRPLPAQRPSELLRVGLSGRGPVVAPLSPADRELLASAGPFSGVTGHHPTEFAFGVAGAPARVWGELVTPDYFDVLEVRPALGRGFAPGEAGAGTFAVVISDRLWKRLFNADPAILTRPLRLNGRDARVVGVAPPAFTGTFPGLRADIWTPASTGTNDADRSLMGLARLRPGVTAAAATAALNTLGQRAKALHPEDQRQLGYRAMPSAGVHPFVATFVRPFMLLLLGLASLALIAACVNVAGLLGARAVARRIDISVRAALGASRRRLVLDLATDALIVGVAGGAAGLLLTWWIVRILSGIELPSTMPIDLKPSVDWRVAGFAAIASAVVALLSGIAPALEGLRTDVAATLKGESESAPRGARFRSVLLGAQTVLAIVLVVVTLLVARGLIRLRGTDPGFNPAGVVTVWFSMESLGYERPRAERFLEEMTTAARQLPSVERASVALFMPLGDRGDRLRISTGEGEPAMVPYNLVLPGFFGVLDIPLVAGRDFNADDRQGAPGVTIVSEELARRSWPGASPLGQQVRLVDRDERSSLFTVVGVTRDMKYGSFGEGPKPFLYLPLRQQFRRDAVLHVKLRPGTTGAAEALATAAHRIDPDVAAEVRVMTDDMQFSLIPLRVAVVAAGTAGAIAVLLSGIGMYALASWFIARRRREFATRVAVGASPRRIVRHVVTATFKPVLVGLVLGAAASVAAAAALASVLGTTGSIDAPAIGLGFAVVLVATAVAVWRPASRAASLPFAELLRQ